jgi:hypothetical protein
MKKSSIGHILILGSLLLSACAGATLSSPERDIGLSPSFQGNEGFAQSSEISSDSAAQSLNSASSGQNAAGERLVIRNAQLTVVVVDPAARAAEIAALAEALGGFVVSSNTYQSTFGDGVLATQASITIRVPADSLDQALDEIKAGAVEVRSENITGQDVTQEYTDLQSQLRNLEAAEVELREIMASLTQADDVLRVFENLRQVRQEIEVTKGRIQYFEQSARLSAISVDLLPDVVSQPLKIGRWQPEGTAKTALEALVNVLRFLADAAIVFVILFFPIILLLGIPITLIRRWIRRRRARKMSNTSQE